MIGSNEEHHEACMARKKPPSGMKDLFVYAHDNRSAILYMATNVVNGKRYIGVTRKKLEERVKLHVMTSGQKARQHQIFARAIRKYGICSFTFEIMCHFDTFKQALAAERQWIAEKNPEYNTTLGGEGTLGYRHSPEKWEEIKKKLKGRPGPKKGIPRDAETLKKISAAVRANPARYWKGKQRSQDTKEKIRLKKTGVPRGPINELQRQTFARNMRKAAISRRKVVICENDGMVFDSLTDACRHYGFLRSTVSMVCRGKRSSVFGYKFKFADSGSGSAEVA